MKNVLDKMCDFGQALCTALLSSHFCLFCRRGGWAPDEEGVAQKGDGLCLRSHSKWMAGPEPTHKVRRVSVSPYGTPPTSTIRRVVLSFYYSHPLPLPAPTPHPRDSEKSQKSCIVIYCLNEPKMTSVHALFISSLRAETH